MENKARIKKLLNEIGQGLYEREDILAKCLLAALSGESTFLFGPPGTAKSLIARRVARAFKNTAYFECLMNRFTTPEEIFGPVSLRELKEDRYLRKTDGYLPEARFAFLDEIWKSGPGILNTLLTIVNERKFRNDGKVESVPLKGIIAASNEIPESGQGLDALYDRLVLRLNVGPLKKKENFFSLLDGNPVPADVTVDPDLAFGEDEWVSMLNGLSEVHFTEESKSVLHAIRKRIDDYNAAAKDKKKSPLYISDRRWKKIAQVLKMAALLCDRKEILPVDLMILSDCLWTEPEQCEEVCKLVIDSVKEFGKCKSIDFEELKSDIDAREKIISKTLYYSDDVYETTSVCGEDCFTFRIDIPMRFDVDGNPVYTPQTEYQIYIKRDYLNSTEKFHPTDAEGKVFGEVRCQAEPGVAFSYETKDRWGGWTSGKEFLEPRCVYKQGDCKPVTTAEKKQLLNDVALLEKRRKELSDAANDLYTIDKSRLESPFVGASGLDAVLSAQMEHLDELEQERLHLERMVKKIDAHVDRLPKPSLW